MVFFYKYVAKISQNIPLFNGYLILSTYAIIKTFYMINKKFLNSFFKITLLFFISFSFNHCGIWDPADARKVPVNAKDRAQKNIEEGRSVRFSKIGKGGSGNFSFASSNEMWRATIEILDFVPLSNADYGGGVVITDWFNDTDSKNESIKIMVQFLSNEIRADGLKVLVYDRFCEDSNLLNCQTSINESEVSEEIKFAILKKASEIRNLEDSERAKEYKKEFPTVPKPMRSP